jgi:RNA polymerase sigma-70 factor (ECF subfamily)
LSEPDAVLVEQAMRGDTRAFATLADRHAAGLFRLALGLVGNRADAEDVVQETFLGAYRGLRGFEGRASFRTWLGQVLVRQAAALRRSRQTRWKFTGGAYPAAQAPATQNPAGQVDRGQDVMAAVAQLSPEHREVVVLRELEQMSYQQIADTLGLPRGTVESRLHRARAQLRTLLGAYADPDGRTP